MIIEGNNQKSQGYNWTLLTAVYFEGLFSAESEGTEAPVQFYLGKHDRCGGRNGWDDYRPKVVVNPNYDFS